MIPEVCLELKARKHMERAREGGKGGRRRDEDTEPVRKILRRPKQLLWEDYLCFLK